MTEIIIIILSFLAFAVLVIVATLGWFLFRKPKPKSKSSNKDESGDKPDDKSDDKNKNRSKDEPKKRSASSIFFKFADNLRILTVIVVILGIGSCTYNWAQRLSNIGKNVPWYKKGSWTKAVFDGDDIIAHDMKVEFMELTENLVYFKVTFVDFGRYSEAIFKWEPKKEEWGTWKNVEGQTRMHGKFRVEIPIPKSELSVERLEEIDKFDIPIIAFEKSVFRFEGLETSKNYPGPPLKNEKSKAVYTKN